MLSDEEEKQRSESNPALCFHPVQRAAERGLNKREAFVELAGSVLVRIISEEQQ